MNPSFWLYDLIYFNLRGKLYVGLGNIKYNLWAFDPLKSQ